MMIKGFVPRLYQETILSTCIRKNTLVVLPTGMGKSMVFVMLAAHRLKLFPNSKILILAPTKPLCEQHVQTMRNYLEISPGSIALFTGLVRPDKREKMWKDSKIIVSTPQGLENDIISKRIDMADVSLLTVDEAHRAVKEYSYVWIAKHYSKNARYPVILGLTASPGSDLETIMEVAKNLHIEDIEVRTYEDPDVKPYIQKIELNTVHVELPERIKEVRSFLHNCYRSKLNELKEYGHITTHQVNNASKKDLLALQAGIHAEIAGGNKDYAVLKSISLLAEIMKVQHALELIETQGATPLLKYLESLRKQAESSKTKAVKNLVADLNFRSALIRTNTLVEEGIEHPKMEELKRIIRSEVENDKNIKIIVFSQYRDSASRILEEVSSIRDVSAKIFVGQAKKNGTGLSQKEQASRLEEFRQGLFNTIIMTSVGEEGLDIPKVDLVIFYEPIPSAIRSIQRRGRTGRQEKGRVILLVTKNTRDEGYMWSAMHKEKRMYRTLGSIKEKLFPALRNKSQPTLQSYAPKQDVKIFVDHREKSSGIAKELIDLGASVKLENIDNADYVLSERVGVELKTVEDFANSLIDGRLLEQVKRIRTAYERPIIIIEGGMDIYSVRNIHPNAIRGLLATIAVSYGVPVLHTKDPKDTASLLWIIARREQEEGSNDFSPHASRKPMSKKEQQEYIVSSIPNIGPSLAKELLKKFGTVKGVVNSDEDALKCIEGIGRRKAGLILDMLKSEYEES